MMSGKFKSLLLKITGGAAVIGILITAIGLIGHSGKAVPKEKEGK